MRQEGYTGGYGAVRQVMREHKIRTREVFIPLVHRPGEAQVDFGEALARIGGVLRKIHFFVMALPHSDAMFVMAFERECTESFQEGHVRAFEHFGGVAPRISYDNSSIAVSQIVGARQRRLTHGFLQLKSHYLFDPHFCLVRRPNEKGVVEGVVKDARQHFMVPVPEVRDLAELNEHLCERCLSDRNRQLRGRGACKSELLKEDQAVFLALPPVPFAACRVARASANSISRVRFDDNDHSVPVAYAHRRLTVKGLLDKIELCYQNELVAQHKRIWKREQVSFEPIHYLELLERKPGALDHARPFEGWVLPECFAALRRRLESEIENGQGVREYIRVLRLLEKHPLENLTRAVERALQTRAHRCDAIAQFRLPPQTWSATTFSLEGRDHLRGVRVDAPDLGAYRGLLGAGGGMA